MNHEVSAKTLLTEYNQKKYREFTLNDDVSLALLAVSSVPGVGASERQDHYEKFVSHPGCDQHVKFIKKNGRPHGLLWQTHAEKLKQAVRWDIVRPHSITGKVVATLGHYRLVAYERMAKGMTSNTQLLKLKLLDLFQDRFEALQNIESLVNKRNSAKKYAKTFQQYIQKLESIKQNLSAYFAHTGLDEQTITEIKNDIEADIERAKSYVHSLENKEDLSPYNRARGQHSVLEFVKQQMIHGLYEFQGINQDLSYSKQRYFALTRGELNDYIEDARKEIDDHQVDLRDAVTAKHHGLYAANPTDPITYDFSQDDLSPARERQILLGISFIEGWDKVDLTGETAIVSNDSGEEELAVIAATRWKTHRNVKALFKSIVFFILNIFKGIFVETHPWEEESWENNNFHLVASKLRQHAKPNEPLWHKPFHFFRQMVYAVVDVWNGVRDFGTKLVIRMPDDIINDWESTKQALSLEETLSDLSNSIGSIEIIEHERLNEILRRCNYLKRDAITQSTSKLATVEYALAPSEQNDILTAIARGLVGFSNVFSHNIYAKDPLGGLLFTATYLIGASAIYFPSATASVFGNGYVDWFSNFSYSMGSSKLGAVIAGGSTQAEVFATAWDGIMHGPSGNALSTLYQLGEDPLTFGAYLGAAYGLGYLLANGIAGHPIPWLSEHLKADLGSVPEAGYPIVGAKVAVMLYEALITERPEQETPLNLSVTGEEPLFSSLSEPNKQIIERFNLATWLSFHAANLQKLESTQLFALSRHIDALFTKEESQSLHELIYPKTQHSIAFHLLSNPLSYIPAVLRLFTSFFLSLIAFGIKNPHPAEPFRRSAEHLIEKIKTDLTRLITFTSFALYLPYSMLSSLIKSTVYIGTMAIGRIASLFEIKPAHSLHRTFAAVHAFFRRVSEFFYPVQTVKNVAVAHPTHTIKELESSYVKLIKQINHAPQSPTLMNEDITQRETLGVYPIWNRGALVESPTQELNMQTPTIGSLST